MAVIEKFKIQIFSIDFPVSSPFESRAIADFSLDSKLSTFDLWEIFAMRIASEKWTDAPRWKRHPRLVNNLHVLSAKFSLKPFKYLKKINFFSTLQSNWSSIFEHARQKR